MGWWSGRNRSELRAMVSFGLLGLFNNISYVIMLAGANSISAAAVGLVYLAAVGPAILVKASGPYWFHLVGYPQRLSAAAVLMVSSFCIVALSSSRPLQLLGVALSSFQGGLGEASCLALTTRYGPHRGAITLWSSGTGFAGIAGYAWVAALHVWASFSFRTTLLLANSLAAGWLLTYFVLLPGPSLTPKPSMLPGRDGDEEVGDVVEEMERSTLVVPQGTDHCSVTDEDDVTIPPSTSRLPSVSSRRQLVKSSSSPSVVSGRSPSGAIEGTAQERTDENASLLGNSARPTCALSIQDTYTPKMTGRERLRLSLSLWPFAVPLFVVYFAEYSMQSGVWTAIGFPVTSAAARHTFYIYANWCYQGGVFLSRSSGMIWRPGMIALWIMPILQACLLAFFVQDAVIKWWYDWSLLVPCFLTGLLGGAVYVNAFALLSSRAAPAHREFSMAAASLADSTGIALADVVGVLLQGCLFKANGLPGADFAC